MAVLIANEPVGSHVEVAAVYSHSNDLFKMAELDSSVLVSGEGDLLAAIATRGAEPLVHDYHIKTSIGPGFTVLAKDLDKVLPILLLHEQFAHAKSVGLSLHVKGLLAGELLVCLLSDVEHLTLKCDTD